MSLIYVIEDDDHYGPLMQASLEEAGFEIMLFDRGSHAIDAARARMPDGLVADMVIRHNNRVVDDGGLSAIWRIKSIATAAGASVFAIAISGAVAHQGMQDILTTAQQLGADVILEKPFDPEDLLFALQSGLKAARQAL